MRQQNHDEQFIQRCTHKSKEGVIYVIAEELYGGTWKATYSRGTTLIHSSEYFHTNFEAIPTTVTKQPVTAPMGYIRVLLAVDKENTNTIKYIPIDSICELASSIDEPEKKTMIHFINEYAYEHLLVLGHVDEIASQVLSAQLRMAK